LTQKQKDFYTEQYFSFIIPDYTNFIVDENDNMVAAGIVFPSFTEALRKAKGRLFPFGIFYMLHAIRHPKKLDFYLIGVKKEYHGRGVISIMMNRVNQKALDNGIEYCETSGELEENKAVQDMWKHYEHRQHKRRRCFMKKL
jgi:GNAT superfamily N-acetyltransferase